MILSYKATVAEDFKMYMYLRLFVFMCILISVDGSISKEITTGSQILKKESSIKKLSKNVTS